MMSPTPSRLALFALLPLLLNGGDVSTTMALQPSSSSSSEPRRSFLARGVSITGAAFLATATADHVAGCACSACSGSSQHRFFRPQAAHAFERRDVGGTDASPATKAMNEQAYQTQARLERDGVRLETSAEQSASLTAALSGYSYSSTPASGKGDNKNKSSSSRK